MLFSVTLIVIVEGKPYKFSLFFIYYDFFVKLIRFTGNRFVFDFISVDKRSAAI